MILKWERGRHSSVRRVDNHTERQNPHSTLNWNSNGDVRFFLTAPPWGTPVAVQPTFEFEFWVFSFCFSFFVHPTIDKVDRNDWRGYFPNTNKTNNNKQTKNKFTVTSLRVLVQPRAKYIAEERRLRNRFAHARNLLLETKCVNSIAGSWRTLAIHCIPIIFDIIALFLLIYFSPYGVAYLYYKNSVILHSFIVYSVF